MPFTGGNEFRVNQQTDFEQTTSLTKFLADGNAVIEERPMQSLAMDANGNIIVTWSSIGEDLPTEPDDWGVYARRYDAATGQWGNTFLVSRDTARAGDQRSGSQVASSVAVDDEGDFIITWTSYSAYQDDDFGTGIYAQRYDRTGAVVGEPFQINTTTDFSQSNSSIAMDSDGDFVVAWMSQNQDDGKSFGIYARRYNKDGTPRDAQEILVNSFTTNDQINPSVAMDANGNFVVVWESFGQTGDESWGIYGQRFNANGVKQGGEFRINQYTTSFQRHASVSMDATGNFVVTWTSNRGGSVGQEIYARRYNSSGVAQGNEFLVNQTSTGTQQHSQVKMLKTGGFLITWTGPDGAGTGIYGRRYGATGQPLAGADGNEFLINTTQAGNQNFASVGADANGNFSIAWTSNQSGNNDIYNRTFTFTAVPNNPPTNITLSNSTIAENVAANFLIGQLTTTDQEDTNQAVFVYEFDPGTGSSDNDAFTIVGNQLRIKNSPDFETKSRYFVRIKTTDSGGKSFSKAFVINITNVNEAPTNISIDRNSINENVAVNTLVGNLSTTDPDANNTFTYTLVSGTGSTDNSAFTLTEAGQLRIRVSPNFEAKQSYSIRVRSTDQNGLFVERVLVISVNDLNEAPTNITLSRSNINENVPPDSTVGTFTATDPDAGETFTYSLVAGTGSTDNAAFRIVNNELRILNSPDFETKSSYAIRVRVRDKGGLTFDRNFTITINDLPETPTNAAPTNVVVNPSSINENVGANALVGTLVATDPNPGDTFTFALVAGTGDTDNGAFTISGNQLRIIANPNFEAKSSYSIRVRVTDRGGLSFVRPLTITVNDLNEAPTDILLTPDNVDENVPANTKIGDLTAVDPDRNETFTYQLVTGTGSVDNAAFTLTPAGALSIRSSPDFELKSSYSIRVRVTDKGGAAFEKVLIVNVNDLPDLDGTPTDLRLSQSEIDENSPPNSVVGTLITVDDSPGPFVYVLDPGFGDASSFAINGNQLILRPSPNFEAKAAYNIRVRTTDPDGRSLSKNLRITVKDLNEAPTDLALSNSVIDENRPANSIVGTLTTTDPDAGNTFTYTLVSGSGSADNSAFRIEGNQLRLLNAPNFETKPRYSIRVRTTDQGGLSFEKALTITVRDLSEAPTDIRLSASSIDENRPADSIIGNFSTVDPDAGDTFTYTLVSGTGSTDNAAFRIDGNRLRIRNSPNFETKSSYSIRVRTTDRTGLSFEKTFIITVNDLNEAPTNITLSPASIDENRPANSIVGTLRAVDPDANDTFTYQLVAGTGSADNAAFTIVGNELRIRNSPNFETKSSYTIRVRTTDSKGLQFERSFTIQVNNLSETPGSNAPTNILLSNNRVDENKPVGTVVGTLSTTDPDQGDTFTYALVSGQGSTDNAAFTIVGNQLRLNTIPDFETKPSYSIRIRTTDSGGRTFERAFTVTVNNLPETPGSTDPRDILLSNSSIEENRPVNTVIGTLSTIDPDQGDSFTYSLVSGQGSTDNASFAIAGNQLRILVSPDFERKSTYSIRVRTRDVGGRTFEKVFTINVIDLPETPGSTAPTDLLLSNSTIDENRPPQSVVGTLSTIDPDQGDRFTYELVAGQGSADNSAFTIVGNQLRINNFPDFETKPSYSIRVRSTDSGGNAITKVFTINVRDLPETPGTTDPRDIRLSNSSVEENRPANTLIGTFSTIDPDVGDSFTYTLAAGTGDTDNAAFTIVNNELRIRNAADFETKPTYSIRVRTRDVGGRTFEKVFTINVIDLPERPGDTPPTDIRLSQSAVNENVPVDTIVGLFSTIDPDQGDSFTYSLEPNFGDNAAFRIVGNELRIRNTPNFETKPSYTIRVRSADVKQNSVTKTFTISVIDQNDAPIVTTTSGSTAYREKTNAVAIDPGVSVSDLDSSNLEGATVQIISGYAPGQDVLALSSGNGITASFDAASGTLTLSGTASLAAYQQALRAVTFLNNSDNPSTTPRTIAFRARDAASSSNLATRSVTIIPVDTAPVVTTSGGSLAYRENSGNMSVDAGINVVDVDSLNLTGATVRLIGYVRDQDRLNITNQDGISSSFDQNTGVLTLSGIASVANYQAALRSLTYLNRSGNPNTSPRTVQFIVRSGSLQSNIATRQIQISSVNSAPVVTTSDGSLLYRESSGQQAIDAQIRVVDVDSQFLTKATVKLQGIRAGQDQLSVTTRSGVTSRFDSNTGTLTLTGRATVNDYQAMLRSVRYLNISKTPTLTARTVQFSVEDGSVASNIAARSIQILPVNDAPVIKASVSAITFTQGSTLIDPQLTVSDIDSSRLAGATIRIGNYIAGEDNLLFKDQNGITGSFDPVAGVLRLTGSAAVISYRTALRSIRFANNRTIPTGTPRTLELQATDGSAQSQPERIKVNFALSGNVPTIDLNGTGVGVDFASTFVISGPPVAVVASDARFTNQNYPVLTSARVTIANPIDGADEKLLADTSGTDITAAYDPTTGVLSLTGRAELADYLKVLRGIKYQNTHPTIDTTTRTILFQVSNGSSTSEPAQTRVQISKINLSNGTLGTDGSLFTTPATDIINASDGDDSVKSLLVNLQQDDAIQGGLGRDTLTLLDGSGNATVDLTNPTNQLGGVLINTTTIRGFEVFRLSGFAGTATMMGGDLDDTLVGGLGNDVINGGAGNDVLGGNAGDDTIDGGLGNDLMEGGLGNDLYIVDSLNDFALEGLNEGNDTVQSAISYTLGNNVENLTLTGSATVGMGNALDNQITGNGLNNLLRGEAGDDLIVGGDGRDELVGGDGNDVLVGGPGRDRLTGGKGKDIFKLTEARRSSRDVIRDFRAVDDTIQIVRNGFSDNLKLGKVRARQFRLGTRAEDSSDRFIYNRSSGSLFFDPDGIGGIRQVQIARLNGRPALTRSDLIVVDF